MNINWNWIQLINIANKMPNIECIDTIVQFFPSLLNERTVHWTCASKRCQQKHWKKTCNFIVWTADVIMPDTKLDRNQNNPARDYWMKWKMSVRLFNNQRNKNKTSCKLNKSGWYGQNTFETIAKRFDFPLNTPIY